MESSVKLYSLKVQEIPKELTTQKIKDIFSEFGDIVDFHVETTWATIQFASKVK